jgi:hypothetical protein
VFQTKRQGTAQWANGLSFVVPSGLGSEFAPSLKDFDVMQTLFEAYFRHKPSTTGEERWAPYYRMPDY